MIIRFVQGMGPTGAVDELVNRYNYQWFAGALVVFFMFIPFFAVRELRQVLGERTMSRLFFLRRSALKTGPDRVQNTSLR
jgi:hypothetical protein